jgi:hypothetical protein
LLHEKTNKKNRLRKMNQQYLFVFYFKTALPNFWPASRYCCLLHIFSQYNPSDRTFTSLGNFTATGRFRRYWDSRHHQLRSGLGKDAIFDRKSFSGIIFGVLSFFSSAGLRAGTPHGTSNFFWYKIRVLKIFFW